MRADNTKAGRLYRKSRCVLAIVALGTPIGCRSGPKDLGLLGSSDPTSTATPDSTISQVAFKASGPNELIDAQMLETVGIDPVSTFDTPDTSTQIVRLDLETIALQSHPAIAEARGKIESARGQYMQAGLPFNPILAYQSQEIGNDGSSGQHSVTLGQQFVTANKLGIAQQVQAQVIQKRQADLRFAELQVLTRLRTAFAQALVAQQRAELTKQLVELSEKSVHSVELLLEAQEVSKVALLQARVESQQAQIAAENAATQLEASRRVLAASAGLPELSPAPIVGDVAEGLTESPWNSLLDQIRTSSPELSAAGSELERARWALQLACAQVTPNITGIVGVGVDTATDDTYGSIGVSMPLPIRNRNQGNIRSARGNIAAASAAIDRTRLDLESRLAGAVGKYQAARQRYERLRDQVIPNAEETFALSVAAFEAGESDYLQLLTAQRTLFNTQLNVLGALGQARGAIAEIEGLLVTLK